MRVGVGVCGRHGDLVSCGAGTTKNTVMLVMVGVRHDRVLVLGPAGRPLLAPTLPSSCLRSGGAGLHTNTDTAAVAANGGEGGRVAAAVHGVACSETAEFKLN